MDEHQFVLRLPPALADRVHENIRAVTEQNEAGGSAEEVPMHIQWAGDTDVGEENERQYYFYIGNDCYKAVLKDLPTITETYKTLDRKSFYKSNNVCQMLDILEDNVGSWESGDAFSTFTCSGLSAAAKDVHKRFHVPARTLVHAQGGRLPKHSTAKDTEKFLSTWLKNTGLQKKRRKTKPAAKPAGGEAPASDAGGAGDNGAGPSANGGGGGPSNSNSNGGREHLKQKQGTLRTVTRKEFVNKESYMNQLEMEESYELVDADGNPLDGEILDDDTIEYIIVNAIKKKKEEKERLKEQEEAKLREAQEEKLRLEQEALQAQAQTKQEPVSPVPQAPEAAPSAVLGGNTNDYEEYVFDLAGDGTFEFEGVGDDFDPDEGFGGGVDEEGIGGGIDDEVFGGGVDDEDAGGADGEEEEDEEDGEEDEEDSEEDDFDLSQY
jgi:hypothetical protein